MDSAWAAGAFPQVLAFNAQDAPEQTLYLVRPERIQLTEAKYTVKLEQAPKLSPKSSS